VFYFEFQALFRSGGRYASGLPAVSADRGSAEGTGDRGMQGERLGGRSQCRHGGGAWLLVDQGSPAVLVRALLNRSRRRPGPGRGRGGVNRAHSVCDSGGAAHRIAGLALRWGGVSRVSAPAAAEFVDGRAPSDWRASLAALHTPLRPRGCLRAVVGSRRRSGSGVPCSAQGIGPAQWRPRLGPVSSSGRGSGSLTGSWVVARSRGSSVRSPVFGGLGLRVGQSAGPRLVPRSSCDCRWSLPARCGPCCPHLEWFWTSWPTPRHSPTRELSGDQAASVRNSCTAGTALWGVRAARRSARVLAVRAESTSPSVARTRWPVSRAASMSPRARWASACRAR